MKPTLIVAVLLLFGCVNEPIAVAEAPAPAPTNKIDVAEEVIEALTLEPEPAPPPKKKKRLTGSRCLDINEQFIGCGWRCMHRGGGVGQCVTACKHLLNKRGWKCLHLHGPGFG